MLGPRWRKVISDLLSNKGRTLLVILSIAVGVFAVGFVMTGFDILLTDMNVDYMSSNAHEAVLYTSPFIDDDLSAIRRMTGIDQAEGRSAYYGRVVLSETNKIPITISGIKNPADLKVDLLKPNTPGSSIPVLGEREILFDRSAMSVLNVKAGDSVSIENYDGKHQRTLKVIGYVHDVNAVPYVFSQILYAYVSPKTIEWMGGSLDYSSLYLTVKENKTDETHVKAISSSVEDKFKKSGGEIYQSVVIQPGRHFASDITKALATIMGILGGLSVFLSAFLVVNTISSLLSQQIRQIGMMKAIGGQTGQIITMYLMMVAGFGLLALALALPLSTLLGYGVAILFSSMLNFELGPLRVPTASLAMQLLVAIGIPVGAALIPIIGGTRVTIREAISSYGLGAGQFGKNFFDRMVEKVNFLSRPLLISLRNAFRRKGRMMLTLSTLTLAGAIFIAVFNLQGAFDITIQQTLGYVLSDINISFDKYYRTIEVYPIVKSFSGVEIVEAWGGGTGQLLSVDKKSSQSIQLIAPPSNSKLIKPTLVKGRWITAGDENAIVIDNHLLTLRPDLKVGDNVIIKINDKEYTWKIVGQYQMAGNVLTPLVYTSYEYLTQLTNQVGKTTNVRVQINPNDPASQETARKTYEAALKAAGINVTDITTGAQVQASNAATTNVLVYFLLVMSVLIAMVGGLGLSGTMSMNIIERTREIGVMRAIGASDRDIATLVLVEGMLIGIISWILGTILAFPISYLLDYAVGVAFIQSPLNFVFQPAGCIIWLVGMVVIAAIASLVPARNASRLTVREVLAYE
jgi:putative ABC transport system permease protein